VDWGEIWREIWDALLAVERWVMDQLIAFAQWVLGIFQQVGQFLDTLFRGLRWFGEHLWRGIKALRHLNFSKIWAKIKAGYKRFTDALDWWRRRVLGPLDRMRRQIWQIYRTFFKPIVMFLDSLRAFTRMIAIFNRKLAARLDHSLMALEGKLLLPITATLHRINEISSYFAALITTAGRLARPLLLESLRRDALLVWEVLTNPRGVLYEPRARGKLPAPPNVLRACDEYLNSRTGPLAEGMEKLDQAYKQGLEGDY
jgi:hypothetical protein